MRTCLLAILVLCLTLTVGCIKAPHLADQTGKSYDAVFSRQESSPSGEAPKAMEAELGRAATRQMVTPSSTASKATPTLVGQRQ